MLVKHPIFVVGNLKATNKMKRIIITFALALFVVAGQAKDKVIERPAFKQTNSLGVIPVKVQLTKDATIVHFRIRYATWRAWSLAANPRLEADAVTQSWSTLCDPVYCGPPGSSVHGIFWARILELVAISLFRGSS